MLNCKIGDTVQHSIGDYIGVIVGTNSFHSWDVKIISWGSTSRLTGYKIGDTIPALDEYLTVLGLTGPSTPTGLKPDYFQITKEISSGI